jgi:glycine hydroxymethyltransferase
MSSLIDLAVFPGQQGGPLEHVIAAKAVAFYEILQDGFMSYAKQIVLNAQAMAAAFTEKGYNIVSGGTDNHLMLIDLRNKNISGKKAENTLVLADITINKNMVPFDDKSPFVTSGIRVGVSAMTTRGLKQNDMGQIVNWLDRVLMSPDDEQLIRTIKGEVNEFMAGYTMYPEIGRVAIN